MELVIENTCCIILSAGLSERMGGHKAALAFSGNENFLQHIIRLYLNAGIKKIVVVINPEIETKKYSVEFPEIIFVENNFPERGRMHSIKLGLNELKNCEFCFIQNIDNPFVTKVLLEQLQKNKSGEGSTAPVYNDHTGHPVLLSKDVIHYIQSLPDEDVSLRDVLNQFPKTKVETDDAKVLVNINTMEEYERWMV